MTATRPSARFPRLVEGEFAFLCEEYGFSGPGVVDLGWQHIEVQYRHVLAGVRVLLENEGEVFVYVDVVGLSPGSEVGATVLVESLVRRLDPSWELPVTGSLHEDPSALETIVRGYAHALRQYGHDVLQGDPREAAETVRENDVSLQRHRIEEWESFVREVERGTVHGFNDYLRHLIERAALREVADAPALRRLAAADLVFDRATVASRGRPEVGPEPRWLRIPRRLDGALRKAFQDRGWTR